MRDNVRVKALMLVMGIMLISGSAHADFWKRLRKLTTLLGIFIIVACSPITMPPTVVDQAAINRETQLQQTLALNPVRSKWIIKQSRAERLAFLIPYMNADMCGKRVYLYVDQDNNQNVICKVQWSIIQSNELNAYANGQSIFITSAMMNFLSSDDEFMFIFSHELAHNIMEHKDSKFGNYLLGALAGGIMTGLTGIDLKDIAMDIGKGAYSQEFELEADYVGLYFAARAGADLEQAANFFRRLGMINPSMIHSNFGSTHPSSVQRFLTIEKTILEIRKKQASGLSLLPSGWRK